MSFQLPPDIVCTRSELPDGTPCWTFRHDRLGQLGRILTHDTPAGQCQIECEIAGDPDDPMIEERKAVFGPLTRSLFSEMERQMRGRARPSTAPRPPRRPTAETSHLVPHKMLQCTGCNAIYAHLIFAEHARTAADMEDCARLTFPLYKNDALPVWIVGAPMEEAVPANTRAMVLKVWPNREPIRWLTPDAFQAIIEDVPCSQCPE